MNTPIRIILICLLLTGVYLVIRESSTTQITTNEQVASSEEVNDSPLTPSPEGDDSIIVNEDQGLPTSEILSKEIQIPKENATWTISYSNRGFSPKTITIKKGDVVRFANNSDSDMWVASNPHPTHTDLSDFDSVRAFTSGEIYTFTFTTTGSFGYHNHLNPSDTGTLQVK